MKLCAISPFISAPRSVVLRFLETCTADLVMLPGALENTPSPLQVQRAIKPGVTVFVEGKGGKTKAVPHLVTCHAMSSMPPQIFWHNPSASDLDLLAAALPKRTFRIGSRRVTFFICGELIAFNPDGAVKHNRSLEYDIVANPAHTMMGHWNHLGRKLETLSLRSAALYAANNDREHSQVSTDAPIYKHGRLVNQRHNADKLTWCECEL